jgi:hypothetical protein
MSLAALRVWTSDGDMVCCVVRAEDVSLGEEKRKLLGSCYYTLSS